jgi:phospholipid-binding lipoprotein MlaA
LAVTGVDVLNTRTNLLGAGQLLDQVALDKYSFLRDAYLATRRGASSDGAASVQFDDDPGDDPKPGSAPDPKGDAKPAAPAAPASAAKSVTQPK